ncbi:MAG: hypothetical protein HC837_15470 [Chloroflexaceae bacterium]|nr:hypothetical protein [Chloroflexaceae bacterium]
MQQFMSWSIGFCLLVLVLLTGCAATEQHSAVTQNTQENDNATSKLGKEQLFPSLGMAFSPPVNATIDVQEHGAASTSIEMVSEDPGSGSTKQFYLIFVGDNAQILLENDEATISTLTELADAILALIEQDHPYAQIKQTDLTIDGIELRRFDVTTRAEDAHTGYMALTAVGILDDTRVFAFVSFTHDGNDAWNADEAQAVLKSVRFFAPQAEMKAYRGRL